MATPRTAVISLTNELRQKRLRKKRVLMLAFPTQQVNCAWSKSTEPVNSMSDSVTLKLTSPEKRKELLSGATVTRLSSIQQTGQELPQCEDSQVPMFLEALMETLTLPL